MEFQDGIELLNYAKKQKNEEIAFQRWLIGGYEKFMSYEKFKQELEITSISTKNENSEEILKKVKDIIILVNKNESI